MILRRIELFSRKTTAKARCRRQIDGLIYVMPDLATAHIWRDERGVAWIDDTNTKVLEVALDMIAHGWSLEEIHFQHSHISLAQIHAALGYYYDHKSEFDEQIHKSTDEIKQLRRQAGESPLRKRLRDMAKLA